MVNLSLFYLFQKLLLNGQEKIAELERQVWKCQSSQFWSYFGLLKLILSFNKKVEGYC